MRVTEPYTIFLRTLSSGKQVYYYQFRDEQGRRSTPKSTGCTTLSQARRFCNKLYNENAFSVVSSTTLENFARGFFAPDGEYCKWRAVSNRPLKPESIRRYTLALENHILPFFGSVKVDKITSDMCKKWIVWASEKWQPKTVNSAQGTLNLIFESAIDKGIIQKNPLRRIGLHKITRKHRELLTVKEIARLYNREWPNESQRQAFLLSCVTGMRIGEVLGLTKEDIRKGFVNVHRTYSDRFGLQESTKTYVNRYVPIPEGFPFPESKTKWAFPAENGEGPVQAHQIYKSFIKRCAALEINTKSRGLTIHTLRNFFISYLQSQNVPESKIRAVAGHSDSTMTDVYTYWTPEMFPEVYEAQFRLYKQITEAQQDELHEVTQRISQRT